MLKTLVIGTALFCAALGSLHIAEARAASVAAPACEAPVPYTSIYYGLEVEVVEQTFRTLFKGAFRQQGSEGLNFSTVLRALQEDFGLEVDVDSFESRVPEEERFQYGLRVSEPTGVNGLSKNARRVFENFPAEISPMVYFYANAYAASCIAAERSANERFTKSMLSAKVPNAMQFRVLDWAMRMRIAGCIGPSAYTPIAATLARRTKASLGTLSLAEHVLATFTLIRTGHEQMLDANDFRPILAQESDREHFRGSHTVLLGRRDVMLAGAYLLAHVLAQGDASAPRGAMSAALQEMQAEEAKKTDETWINTAWNAQVRETDPDTCSACEPGKKERP